MRPIKFRAWDKTSKKWFPFSKNEWANICPDGEIVHGHGAEVCCEVCCDYECELALEVSFFTGLHDLNEKEIFENDLIFKESSNIVRQVKWLEKEATFYFCYIGSEWKKHQQLILFA